MKVLIHDLQPDDFKYLNDDQWMIIDSRYPIQHCLGCFGCWIHTPGQCILKDRYQTISQKFSQGDELIIISKLVYGGYSPFVKNVIDRSIGYLLPFFRTYHKEQHHQARYPKQLSLRVYFYHDNLPETIKATARQLVKANSLNFNIKDYQSYFYSSTAKIKEVLQ